jgi:hypothetical protein
VRTWKGKDYCGMDMEMERTTALPYMNKTFALQHVTKARGKNDCLLRDGQSKR